MLLCCFAWNCHELGKAGQFTYVKSVVAYVMGIQDYWLGNNSGLSHPTGTGAAGILVLIPLIQSDPEYLHEQRQMLQGRN